MCPYPCTQQLLPIGTHEPSGFQALRRQTFSNHIKLYDCVANLPILHVDLLIVDKDEGGKGLCQPASQCRSFGRCNIDQGALSHHQSRTEEVHLAFGKLCLQCWQVCEVGSNKVIFAAVQVCLVQPHLLLLSTNTCQQLLVSLDQEAFSGSHPGKVDLDVSFDWSPLLHQSPECCVEPGSKADDLNSGVTCFHKFLHQMPFVGKILVRAETILICYIEQYLLRWG